MKDSLYVHESPHLREPIRTRGARGWKTNCFAFHLLMKSALLLIFSKTARSEFPPRRRNVFKTPEWAKLLSGLQYMPMFSNALAAD